MKAFFLTLAVLAGGLSLTTTLGIMRSTRLTPMLALLAWLVALGMALIALYALRTAMRYRVDRLSINSEEGRLRGRYGNGRTERTNITDERNGRTERTNGTDEHNGRT